MPGQFCETVERFREDALRAQDEREIQRLLEQARQMLRERGVHCYDFVCLQETLTAVMTERAKRRQALQARTDSPALPAPEPERKIGEITTMVRGGEYELKIH